MNNKKLRNTTMAFAVATAMALGTASFAMAADTYTLEVNTNEKNAASTFTAYEVMKATEESEGIYTYTVTDAFKAFFANGANGYTLNDDNEILNASNEVVATVAADAYTNKVTYSTDPTEAAKLASALEKYAVANGIAGKTLPAADLEAGYYLVAETADTNAANGYVASKPMLTMVLEDETVTPKADEVTLEKLIVENPQAPTDENNVSIGDDVPYLVTSAIPTYKTNVDTTKVFYRFIDTFEKGLTFNQDKLDGLVVTAGEDTLVKDTDYTAAISENADGETVLTVEFAVSAIMTYQGKDVTLEYSAVLNENAKINNTDGNVNDVKLQFANNPNMENSTGELEDDVKTYTYGFQFRKVDKNDFTQDMSGAKFTVKDADENEIAVFEYDSDGNLTVTDNANDAEDSDIIVNIEGQYATIKGLDEGEYTITEDKAPDGYAILGGDVKVTIEDVKDSDGTPSGIAKVTTSGAGGAVIQDKTDKDSKEKVVSELVNDNGKIDVVVRVSNTKGISLPETGAKTALYCMIGGGVLLALGGIFLTLTKKFAK